MHSQSLCGLAAFYARLRHSLLPVFGTLLFFLVPDALAHGVAEGDKGFI